MDERGISIQICNTVEEIEATQGAEMAIIEGLGDNTVARIGIVELGRALRIFLRDRAGEVVGGVLAHCFGGWLYIALLWVQESLRNLGYSTRLMQLVETEAVRFGCRHAHVDTFSFEARPFYERLGYELFATLEDYPQGHSKHFLEKRLVP